MKKIALHLVSFFVCFPLNLREKLFKFTQNGIFTVCFSVAVFKYITSQVTTKHFFEICLNLSFSLTMKLPGSSACDMTELGWSWPTAIIIGLHSLLPEGGKEEPLKKSWSESHLTICTGKATQWDHTAPVSHRSQGGRTTEAEPRMFKLLRRCFASLQFVTPLVAYTCPAPFGRTGNILKCLQTKVI